MASGFSRIRRRQKLANLSSMPEIARNQTAVDICEREIRRWIVGGDIRPGDRLPPERALATRLGVNRTTLRSALTRLSSARLLCVRQGSGYVVQDYRKVAGLELLPDITRSGAAAPALVASDLLAVRRQLLRMALESVQHARPADVTPVLEAVERFGDVVRAGSDIASLAAAEHDVFAAILTAAGTPVVALCANPIDFALRAMPALAEAMFSDAHGQLVLAWTVVRWLEQPTSQPLAGVMTAVERRDHATLARLSGKPVSEPDEAKPLQQLGYVE